MMKEIMQKMMKETTEHLKHACLITLMALLFSGCQSTPKEPKRPDPYPRFPINKTIPPELVLEGGVLQESSPQEESE